MITSLVPDSLPGVNRLFLTFLKQPIIYGFIYVNNSKSAFTCNRDEISSQDETRPGMKKFLFTGEFHPGMKRVEFHPGMKFNLKENLPLSMKTYNKIYH